MISRTKFEPDFTIICQMFEKADLGKVEKAEPLGAGEYNAVYSVTADGKPYVLKIAPANDTEVLTYEKDIMHSEVYWLKQMRAHTSICVPQVYFEDFSRQLLPADYFIMERMNGRQLNEADLSKEEMADARRRIVKMTAQLHRVKHHQYGYIQNALYADWYTAIFHMTENLIADCHRVGRQTKRGEKLLYYICKHKGVLEQAPCTLVNYDIWDPNILCEKKDGKLHLAWIDPERSFWGDPLFDFCCLELMVPLEKKTLTLTAYNAVADVPVTASRDERIRYAVSLGYMALVQEAEKYYRYIPHHFGWWRNVFSSVYLYKRAFRILKG